MCITFVQTVSKFNARSDLSLSTTIPALRFEPENIYILKDECKQ